jgi:hypothetical protein
LARAQEECNVVTRPSPIVVGRLAPAIKSRHEERDFFHHFNSEGYEIAHFFCHCSYDVDGFVLTVSTDYPLKSGAFHEYRARFPDSAFHFVNVCAGAPTPENRQRSFLEYLYDQQRANSVVASLISVRSAEAVDMARAFYDGYLPKTASESGRSAAEALWEARQQLLKSPSCSPVGYLYRVYGRPDARLVPLELHMEARNGVGG